MADVKPFRGLRYSPERVGDPSLVISPPYDVISPPEQLNYHQRSPYNIIRLEFGEEKPDDSPEENKYTRAATTMGGWLGEATLVREERPAFYLIEHRFSYGGERSRFSLIARVRLEELGSGQIRPHEATMTKPAADRSRLIESCRANFSPVMALYSHQGERGGAGSSKKGVESLFPEATSKAPSSTAVDDNGVAYNMWVIADEKVTTRVSQFFANKALYIADGHHRYETALSYREAQRRANPSYTGGEAFNFVMMTITDSQDPNLVMLPTHRLVRGVEAGRLDGLRETLSLYFDMEELAMPSPSPSETLASWLERLKEQGVGRTAFGLYGLHGERLCLLTARKAALEEKMPPDQPQLLRKLDVNILHWTILRGMLGIDSPEMEEYCLEYTRDGSEVLHRVDSGEYQLAFLLNPATISSMLAVADSGTRMPQKSTYFHPKTPAGLVINPLWGD